MFLEMMFKNPHRFGFILVTVIVSIVLHELAHGWAAIWQGDRTPIEKGHMTANPIVHMGWFSIFLLLMMGMAFGLMPVNPANFRSKYGDAMVAAAGPAMNLLLALVSLSILGIWIKFTGFAATEPVLKANAQDFLWYFGSTNIALAILNLLPIPPLDGSAIWANFHPGYAKAIRAVRNPQVFMFALLGILIVMSKFDFGFMDLAQKATLAYLNQVWGAGLELTGG
jgi:Zn-dependent protease